MDNRKNGLLDCVIVGGCGHVGLPLALSFADVGCRVGIHDIDTEKIAQVKSGTMPFLERGAEELLRKLLQTGRLEFSDQVDMVGRSDIVVTVIGTPIDEFMNPSMRLFERVVDQLAPHLRNGSLLVLRSTVYPGTTEYVETRLRDRGVTVEVAFCPERIAEGYALEENRTLPQVIGVHTDAAFERAATFFQKLDVEVIRTTTEEAEMAKLMTNTWRYMKFAIANQFFQIAHSAGLDYSRILHAVRHNYPRAADLPGPGFAAGPCLLKDTMQLAAYSPDHFPMGHSAGSRSWPRTSSAPSPVSRTTTGCGSSRSWDGARRSTRSSTASSGRPGSSAWAARTSRGWPSRASRMTREARSVTN